MATETREKVLSKLEPMKRHGEANLALSGVKEAKEKRKREHVQISSKGLVVPVSPVS